MKLALEAPYVGHSGSDDQELTNALVACWIWDSAFTTQTKSNLEPHRTAFRLHRVGICCWQGVLLPSSFCNRIVMSTERKGFLGVHVRLLVDSASAFDEVGCCVLSLMRPLVSVLGQVGTLSPATDDACNGKVCIYRDIDVPLALLASQPSYITEESQIRESHIILVPGATGPGLATQAYCQCVMSFFTPFSQSALGPCTAT